MKNYQFKWLLLSIILSLASINIAWAGNVHTKSGSNIYFDDSNSDWGSSYMYFAIGFNGNNDATLMQFSKITNTKLYVLSSSNWDNADYCCIMGAGSSWGTNGGTYSNMETYADHVSGKITTYTFKAGEYNLITPTDGTGGTAISASYKGTSDGCIGKTDQTVNVVVNGSSSPATSPAAISITSYYWNGWNAVAESTSSNITKGGPTITDTWSNVAYTAKTTVVVTSTTSGYYFVGWYDAATGGNLVSSNTSYTYYPRANKTLYARFETRYSVTVNAGSNGTTTPSSGGTVTAGYYTSAAINASANPGYYFTNWTKNNNNVSFGSSTSTASNSVTATGTATVTANFAQKYVLRGSKNADGNPVGGMPGWSATTNTPLSIDGNVMTFTATLTDAKTQYKCKIYDVQTTGYYGQTGTGEIGHNTAWTLNGSNDVKFTTKAPGTYTFTYNVSNGSFKVLFPTYHTVTFGNHSGKGTVTGTNGGYSIGSSSPGYAVSGTNVIMTAVAAEGYTFTKWVDGSGNELSTSNPYTISSINADKTVRAVFTPITYKITFDPNGGSISNNGSTYEESSERKINATYDAAVSGTMPTAVKNGRHFVGWYTASGAGYPVIDEDGTWKQVAGYTDASKHWIRAENTTLYAHYMDPTFLSVDFSPKYAMPESDITATVSFSSAIGDPEGIYTLCCKLSTKSGTVLQAQPTITHDGVNPFVFTFTAPSSPGEYALQVKLFPGTDNVCGGNSPIATIEGGDFNYFDVEDMNPITITYECGGVELRESTTIYATWNNRATVTAPSIPGMNFDHWEYTNCTIEDGTAGRYEEPEATFYAFTTGSAKAVYTQGSLFFKDTKGWGEGNIYIYFYSSNYWHTKSNADDPEGTGSATSSDYSPYNGYFHSGPFLMTKLEGTDDVYYYNGEAPAYAAVAFANESMENYQFFANTTKACEVVYVNAFDANKPMIVPVGEGADWNKGYAHYYSHDLAPLLQDWGALIKSDVDSYATTHHLKSAKMGDLSFSTKIYLPRYSYSYQWILTQGATSYGRDSYPTLTYSSPTSDNLISGKGNLCAKTDIPGEYIFTVTYGTATGSEVYTGAATSDGLLKHATVTLTYPLKVGDYRLVYDDSNLDPHPSDIIKKENNGESIVSMFYNPNATPVLKIQSCTAVATNLADDADPITWSSPTTINLSSYSSVLTEAGVYNFTITLDANGANPSVTNVEKYTGRFYVRTDCVNSDKWNYKDSKDDHAMTYSDYSTTLTNKPYSHYYVKDLHGTSGSPINIRFTVATDYSEAITDTVFAGDVSGDYQDYYGSESLHLTQNVRFSYNQKTNKIWRAYTEGPTNNDYMVLRSGSGLYATKDAESPTATFKFTDMGNWVYQVDVYSLVNTRVKLTADIHKHTAADNNDSDAADNVRQYLKGKEGKGTDGTEWTGDDAVLLLGGSGESKEHMRITYDFKTDRMTTAWLPSGTVSTDLSIYADVMMLRREQEGATSIVIGTKGEGVYATLSNVEKAYGVMEFRKSYINDISLSRYERNLYWISFPFDVKLSDVFGFGKYGQHWIIEYYDGKGRAQKGYWADSEPNWKYVSEEVKDEFTLKANEGYILALALSNMGNSSSIWTSGSESLSSVYLYFPSSSNIGNITNITSYKMPLDSVGYKCKITRDHRDVKDSYWHCIGVPSYGLNRLTGVSTTVPGNGEDWSTPLPYVYKWDSIYNKLEIASSSTFTFEAMKSYLIQYANNEIVWANVTNKPQTVVSRNRVEGEDADFYEWKLNLMKDNKRLDHTYVRLSEDENATEGYDFGNDLSKEFNSGANIFTYVDGIEVAGNVMPVVYGQTRTVPVGVKITEAGDYTFSMPDGTNGVGVILLDNIAGTRTNLALEDYTVNLTTGTYDGRFSLEISPIVQTPTDIEHTSSDSMDGVRKVMVDGVLYIVKDSVVFDACGNRVK